MHVQDLPEATQVDWVDGKLLYCEDGVAINQISTSLFKHGGGGGGGGGGISYSTEVQDTGLTWIDDRPIYQITFDLSQYEPYVDEGTGQKTWTIDVDFLNVGDIITIEQMGYFPISGSISNPYLYTQIAGYKGGNLPWYAGLNYFKNQLIIVCEQGNDVSYVTIRYIEFIYKIYEWDFRTSLVDKNYGIEFNTTATRDVYGLHFGTSDYATLLNQGEDWTPSNPRNPSTIPSFTRWKLEMDIESLSNDYSADKMPTLLNTIDGYSSYLGINASYEWVFNPSSATTTSDVDLGVSGVNYFNGHTLKITRIGSKYFIYRDNVLLAERAMGSSELVAMGNIPTLGNWVTGSFPHTQTFPGTITRYKFMRDIDS